MINHTSRGALPLPLTEAMERSGRLHYTEAYACYVTASGGRPIYLYDEDFVLLAVVRERLCFRFADFPTEYHCHSGNREADPSRFLDGCMARLEAELKVHWTNQPDTSARFGAAPGRAVRIPYGNYLVDLSQEEAVLWDGLQGSARNRIRKAESAGVTVVCGGQELLEDFYGLYRETGGREGFSCQPKTFFEAFFRHLPAYSVIFAAYAQGKLQGASFCLWDSSVCYDLYACSAVPSVPGAGNLLVWEAMRQMKRRGVGVYSLVGARIDPEPGSKQERINRFKRTFTAWLEPCYLFKTVFSPGRHRLYEALKKVLRPGAPPADVIDEELHKWAEMNSPAPRSQERGRSERRMRRFLIGVALLDGDCMIALMEFFCDAPIQVLGIG